jgi:hypothetical protein
MELELESTIIGSAFKNTLILKGLGGSPNSPNCQKMQLKIII